VSASVSVQYALGCVAAIARQLQPMFWIVKGPRHSPRPSATLENQASNSRLKRGRNMALVRGFKPFEFFGHRLVLDRRQHQLLSPLWVKMANRLHPESLRALAMFDCRKLTAFVSPSRIHFEIRASFSPSFVDLYYFGNSAFSGQMHQAFASACVILSGN
jgi:hypothetical protein